MHVYLKVSHLLEVHFNYFILAMDDVMKLKKANLIESSLGTWVRNKSRVQLNYAVRFVNDQTKISVSLERDLIRRRKSIFMTKMELSSKVWDSYCYLQESFPK